MLTVTLPFKRLDERAVIPQYANEGDSGMDVYALGAEAAPVRHDALQFIQAHTGA